jgi:hypothetical protein
MEFSGTPALIARVLLKVYAFISYNRKVLIIRRAKLLSLSWGLTLSWVVYRVVVLLVIFMYFD